MSTSPIVLAITGASGSIYGLRLLEHLLIAQQSVYLLISEPARLVIEAENSLKIPHHPIEIQNYFCEYFDCSVNQLRVFGLEQWESPAASGSARSKGMVICPCSSGTLASIAQGLSRNLIERVASVMLKERRPLMLVHRETPLSAIHLENMLRLTHAGAVILPASPAFYHLPQTINELVDFIVGRILDHLAISHTLITPWGENIFSISDN